MFWIAEERPELFDLYVRYIFDHVKFEDIPERYKLRWKTVAVELCRMGQMYKYNIAMDGYIAGWERHHQILYSDAVPIIVETLFQPIY